MILDTKDCLYWVHMGPFDINLIIKQWASEDTCKHPYECLFLWLRVLLCGEFSWQRTKSARTPGSGHQRSITGTTTWQNLVCNCLFPNPQRNIIKALVSSPLWIMGHRIPLMECFRKPTATCLFTECCMYYFWADGRQCWGSTMVEVMIFSKLISIIKREKKRKKILTIEPIFT